MFLSELKGSICFVTYQKVNVYIRYIYGGDMIFKCEEKWLLEWKLMTQIKFLIKIKGDRKKKFLFQFLLTLEYYISPIYVSYINNYFLGCNKTKRTL